MPCQLALGLHPGLSNTCKHCQKNTGVLGTAALLSMPNVIILALLDDDSYPFDNSGVHDAPPPHRTRGTSTKTLLSSNSTTTHVNHVTICCPVEALVEGTD